MNYEQCLSYTEWLEENDAMLQETYEDLGRRGQTFEDFCYQEYERYQINWTEERQWFEEHRDA